MEEQHIAISRMYFSNLSTTCVFTPLPDNWWKQEPQTVGSHLRELFLVPRLKNSYQNQNRINKCQLLQVFLSFLVQLLYHKTNPILENLEGELRCLLTILGDISWLLLDFHDQPQFTDLMAELESVVNKAGCFLHSLLFSPDQELHQGHAAVLQDIHLLTETLQTSDLITPSCTTPRTSTVNSLLILDSLVGDLDDLLKGEDDRIADVKDQIYLLHQGLLFLHSALKDVRSPQLLEIALLEEPLMRIGDIAHQAEYLIAAFLVKHVPLLYIIARLENLSHKIDVLRMNLSVIIKECRFGGLEVTVAVSFFKEKDNLADDTTVGFEDIERVILDQLDGGTRDLNAVLIWGMPGLGKTALAKKLYNHPLVKNKFQLLSWCSFSREYETWNILANILIQIDIELTREAILRMEGETLSQHIYQTLKGRRYLIVMDDVWFSNVWHEFRRCFPDDTNGSRILLTSRNVYVAPPHSITHELPFLSDEQCWKLLERKLFGTRTCPPELQRIGKKIAARCCGLPLTVVVIAGVLSTVGKDENRWEQVLLSLASYIENDHREISVMQILELSYKHLPDHLKPCFLHLGAFKEDQEVSVGKLKRFWIAEGFLQGGEEKSGESVAEEYLMELINRSLVMVGKRRSDGRGVKTCIVHDLLRQLCLKKSKEESFIENSNNESCFSCEKGHRVRALGVSTTSSLGHHIRSFYGDGSNLSLYVGNMRLLRVLNFNHIMHGVRLYGTEYLVNLKFLVIGEMPMHIEELRNLKYLIVMSSGRVCILPPIDRLKKLRCIDAQGAEYGENWNSSSTNNLEYLSQLTVERLRDEELLKCSPHLRKLECKYLLSQMQISSLSQLHSLSLVFYRTRLEEFGFPSNIRKLTLTLSRFSWERMSIVGRLENLEVLKLMTGAAVGDRWDTRDGEFKKLRFLKMEDIYLSEWNVDSYDHFPLLQQLILVDCYTLEEIPSEIGNIDTLKLIEISGQCWDPLKESAERMKEAQLEMGNEDLKIVIIH